MFEQTASYEAWFLPGPDGMPPDEAMKAGLRWLVDQPGSPLVALSAKKMVGNNRVLRQAAQSGRFDVAAPPGMWLPGWAGGAVLAPWASRRVLDGIDDDLGGRVSAVCVIGWVDGAHDEWRAARGARDLRDPESPVAAGPVLDPVVVAAMTEVSRAVNHNNALVQTEDKAYAVLRCSGWRRRDTGTTCASCARGLPGTGSRPWR